MIMLCLIIAVTSGAPSNSTSSGSGTGTGSKRPTTTTKSPKLRGSHDHGSASGSQKANSTTVTGGKTRVKREKVSVASVPASSLNNKAASTTTTTPKAPKLRQGVDQPQTSAKVQGPGSSAPQKSPSSTAPKTQRQPVKRSTPDHKEKELDAEEGDLNLGSNKETPVDHHSASGGIPSSHPLFANRAESNITSALRPKLKAPGQSPQKAEKSSEEDEAHGELVVSTASGSAGVKRPNGNRVANGNGTVSVHGLGSGITTGHKAPNKDHEEEDLF